MKERLRREPWSTSEEFEPATMAVWKGVKLSEILSWIFEMPQRFKELAEGDGKRIRSKSW